MYQWMKERQRNYIVRRRNEQLISTARQEEWKYTEGARHNKEWLPRQHVKRILQEEDSGSQLHKNQNVQMPCAEQLQWHQHIKMEAGMDSLCETAVAVHKRVPSLATSVGSYQLLAHTHMEAGIGGTLCATFAFPSGTRFGLTHLFTCSLTEHHTFQYWSFPS